MKPFLSSPMNVNSREASDCVNVHRLVWYPGGRGAVGPMSMGRREWWYLQRMPSFQRGNPRLSKWLNRSPWAWASNSRWNSLISCRKELYQRSTREVSYNLRPKQLKSSFACRTCHFSGLGRCSTQGFVIPEVSLQKVGLSSSYGSPHPPPFFFLQ